MRLLLASAASITLTFGIAAPALAEEGMWPFDAVPTEAMKADYGWAPDQKWLDHTRLSAVRLTGGCSASFVSDAALILTNHHCVISCLQNLSSAEEDLVAGGFNAADRSKERQCPGQQAEVVTSITDATADIKGVIGTLTGEALVKARDARIADIEAKSCPDRAATRCQVVTLFGGGQYKLYQYRKYSDVRIAWAPEFQAAFFGGDPDNFNFPRYAMDAAFLRAYEGGKPVKPSAHLQWNPRAPKEGELTFVVGNPGSTQRLLTETQRAFQRTERLPTWLILFSEYRGRLLAKMQEGPDKAREGADELFGYENNFKSFMGQFRALNDPAFTAKMTADEADLRQRVAGNAAIGDPWASIDAAVADRRNYYYDSLFLQGGPGAFSTLAAHAQTLVQAAAERGKPNGERLPGFTDSALPLTEKRLLDDVPTYGWMEQLAIEFWASKAREYLGADNADMRALLGNESPEAFGERMAKSTKLSDPAVRKALWDGGAAAIAASDDPLIRFFIQLDPRSRAIKDRFDRDFDAPVTAAQSKLAEARFAAYGDKLYPDATFTLRLSYGAVRGWNERGRTVPPTTNMGGTFTRATGQTPFTLAKGFVDAEARMNKQTVYNFVTTNDIIGGNSGSPVIDRDGSVIGAAFDGNIHSLGGNFGYDGALNRTVVVSTAAVQEALETIWPAPALVSELAGGKMKRK